MQSLRLWVRLLGWLGACTCVAAGAGPQPWVERELPAGVERMDGHHYLVALPEGYEQDPNKKWPVIVFLHGRGEWGDDFATVKKRGLAQYITEGHRLPAIVLAPQSPQERYWHPLFVNAVMEDAAQHYRFDPERIYLTGLSMGGIGSWSTAMVYPQRFAVLVPIAGCLINDIAALGFGQDHAPDRAWLPVLARLKNLPTWVFHGDRDSLVPTELGQRSADLLTQAGGQPRRTIYPMTDHDSWTPTYFDNAEFYPWLLAQRNPQPQWDAVVPALDLARYVGDYGDARALRAQVRLVAGGLRITWLPEGREERLLPLDEHQFIGNGLVLFHGNAGHMQGVEYPGIGGVAPYRDPAQKPALTKKKLTKKKTSTKRRT